MDEIADIVVLYQEKKYYLKNKTELVELFFGKEYSDLSKEEKLLKRYNKVFALSKFSDIPIVYTDIGILGDDCKFVMKEYDILKSIIINNEITCILSFCKYDNCLILEKIDVNESLFQLNLITEKQIDDNYFVVNSYLDKLMIINLPR